MQGDLGLSCCALSDDGVFVVAQSLASTPLSQREIRP